MHLTFERGLRIIGTCPISGYRKMFWTTSSRWVERAVKSEVEYAPND